MHKGTQYDRTIEYFRGIQFHVLVLSNSSSILQKLASFKEDKILPKLETIEESTKLGQFMLFEQMISKG